MYHSIDDEKVKVFLTRIVNRCMTESDEIIGSNPIEKRIKLAELNIEQVLEALADDWCVEVRIKVARNPNTTVSVLERLAKDKDWQVRYEVAENPSTPAGVLKILADDENWNVRYLVAENPNTPISVLERLAKDKERIIRRAVAKRKKKLK